MKVIFLDIDGVLNSIDNAAAIAKITGKRVPYGPVFVEEPFTRENLNWGAKLVENLKRIVDETDALIVIISTWKEKFLYISQFEDMFEAYGWKRAPVYDLATSYLTNRGQEIDTWMYTEQNREQMYIKSYVIIDDNDDFSDDQREYLILTDRQVGLTEKDAERAIHILNNTP